MPTPNAGESKSSYIKRCVDYLVHKEGKKSEQAVGQCYSMWDSHTKKRGKTK